MASDWLDIARFADTHGYQRDAERAMWPYRDWVIKAFNENLPFDQFMTYQRSLYTFWKRTVPPPSMMTFDAADRSNCTVRR